MSDPKVLDAQRWVNLTYGDVSGYERCEENGRTGWPTMFCLTRALQHELGITTLSDNFGPTTMARLTSHGPIGPATTNRNIVKIVQHALFCKGYWGGDGQGYYDSVTAAAVSELKTNMGLVPTFDNLVQPKVFKALLTMDAYVLLSGGSNEIRTIQRYFNGRYWERSTYFIMPCDGHYSRDVQQALMKIIQYEIGIPDENATGSFGPATQQGLRDRPVSAGSPEIWVRLFSAACVFNGSVNNTSTVFKTSWDDRISEYVRAFQAFSQLPQTGIGDYQTWAQLLVSTGDADRTATAGDTRFHISASLAQALRQAGYQTVGRYLDEDESSTLDKELQPGELAAIFAGGMRVFPISQYYGRDLSEFNHEQGVQHAIRAHDRAVGYGFNRGTVIYFAVDYDALDYEITSNIVPYFHGVQAGLASRGRRYIAGVYGSRNVCSRVSAEAYARYSFVAGMSWGFSGNLGFPLPANWSFNQIKELVDYGINGTVIDFDRNVHRAGSDPGVGPENVNGTTTPVAQYLEYVDTVYAAAAAYNHGNPNLRVMEFLRHPRYTDNYTGWEQLIGDVDRDWISYARERITTPRIETYVDPSYGITVNVDHFAATANAVYLMGVGNGSQPGGAGWRGDFGGWGGDLSTFYAEWQVNRASYASGYAFCEDRLAKLAVPSSFSFDDLIEDADGYLIGKAVRDGADIRAELRRHLEGTGHVNRFRRFFQERFGGTVASAVATARTMLCDVGDDDVLDLLRAAAIIKLAGVLVVMPTAIGSDRLDPFLHGYAELLQTLAGQETALARILYPGKED